jgi:hypothetical protein
MSRLVLADFSAAPLAATRERLELLVRRSLRSGLAVRLLLPRARPGPQQLVCPQRLVCPQQLVCTVPIEPVLPHVAALRSADPDTGPLEDLVEIPAAVSEALAAARLHPGDILLVPDAGPLELIGLARWLRANPARPAVVASIAAAEPTSDPTAGRRLHQLAARLLDLPLPHRVGLCAPADRAAELRAAGYQVALTATLDDLIEGLLPPHPGSPPPDVPPRAGLVDPVAVRLGLGLPVAGTTVLIWAPAPGECDRVLEDLAALPWAAGITCLVVGSGPAGRSWPFVLGTLPPPATPEQLAALGALADLHVMAAAEADRAVVRAVMTQGRAALCPSGGAEPVDASQTYEAGSLQLQIAGLLLRPDHLKEVGQTNRTKIEEAQCASA